MVKRGEEHDPDIGQHILKDRKVLDKVVQAVPPGRTIVEIGAGPGNLTKELTRRSKRVVAIEIDQDFEPELRRIQQRQENLQVVINNAVERTSPKKFRRLVRQHEDVWVAGNIPYHITEPLMMNLVRLPVKGATFLVGARFATRIQADKTDREFGKLTKLVNTFFKPQVLEYVDKKSFTPPPRTTSSILRLERRGEEEYQDNQSLFLWRELFDSAPKGTKVKNALRRGLIRYAKQHNDSKRREKRKPYPVLTKNEARQAMKETQIPDTILDKSVEQLTNEDFATLEDKIKQLTSR